MNFQVDVSACILVRQSNLIQKLSKDFKPVSMYEPLHSVLDVVEIP